MAVFFLLPFPVDLSLDWALNQLFEAALEALFFVASKGFFASLGVAGFFLGVAGFFFSDVNFLVCGFGFFGAVTEPALLFEPPPSPFFAALLGVVVLSLALRD